MIPIFRELITQQKKLLLINLNYNRIKEKKNKTTEDVLEKEASNLTEKIREDFGNDLSWILKAGQILAATDRDESSKEKRKCMSKYAK